MSSPTKARTGGSSNGGGQEDVRRFLTVGILQQASVAAYVCPDCGKRDNNKRDHERHVASHKDNQAWKCTRCGRTLSRRDKLKTHLEKKHLMTDKKDVEKTLEKAAKAFLEGKGVSNNVPKKKLNSTVMEVAAKNTVAKKKQPSSTFF